MLGVARSDQQGGKSSWPRGRHAVWWVNPDHGPAVIEPQSTVVGTKPQHGPRTNTSSTSEADEVHFASFSGTCLGTRGFGRLGSIIMTPCCIFSIAVAYWLNICSFVKNSKCDVLLSKKPANFTVLRLNAVTYRWAHYLALPPPYSNFIFQTILSIESKWSPL